MTTTLKYYINTLTELEYAKFLADSSWLIELKTHNSTGCNLMLNNALDTLVVSILHSNICGDSNKQLSKILVLVAL